MSSAGQQDSTMAPAGPPYAPQGALLGGIPTPSIDTPIDSVFIVLFILSAALNMTILQLNLRRSPRHKFLLSGLLFGFSMARITANVMRIVWASFPSNIRICIATVVFTNAGVILLFVVNLILSQRLLRALHPRLGWSTPGKALFRFLYFCVAACFAMVVVAVIYSFYTLDSAIQGRLHDIQLFAVTLLAALSFLPLPVLLFCLLWPRSGPADPFGTGSMRAKVLLLAFTSVLLSLGASFRAGTSYFRRPADDPAWFQSRACFYCFNFVIELTVLFTYALSRFDRRFHIPDGSCAPGDYSRRSRDAEKSAGSASAETDVEERA